MLDLLMVVKVLAAHSLFVGSTPDVAINSHTEMMLVGAVMMLILFQGYCTNCVHIDFKFSAYTISAGSSHSYCTMRMVCIHKIFWGFSIATFVFVMMIDSSGVYNWLSSETFRSLCCSRRRCHYAVPIQSWQQGQGNLEVNSHGHGMTSSSDHVQRQQLGFG
jgi:hypothetical protein